MMSYPPPRYTGDTGEASATLRRHDQPPELVQSNGGAVHYLATGATTAGEFGLYRWDFGTGPSGPDPHFHRTISESFFILSGVVSVYDGKDWVDARPGDFLFVPEGGVHGFKNASEGATSMLILFAPGAPREEYFETLAALRKGKKLSEEELAEFYVRHDTYWT
jgi:mannose-6-phosphate isomerase-like protein (cupin superfamily)